MAGEWSLERIVRLSNAYYNKGLEKAQVRDMSGAGGPPDPVRVCEMGGVSMFRPV